MRAAVFAFVLGCVSLLHGQKEWPHPKWEKVESVGCRASDSSASIHSKIGSYEVRIAADAKSPSDQPVCRAFLTERGGKETLLLEDAMVSIHQGSGKDLFADGNPSLVLEGFSGGAHCCYTYRIVSLSEPPIVLPPIQNETPFYFFKDDSSGEFRILTSDGAFDYFDGLCHACTPFPHVVLQVDRNGLHNVSPQFVEQYDSEIAFARAKIAQGKAGKFVESDFKDARAVALEIAFSYLYSGRESEAWQSLNELWPANDRSRIEKLILDTRARGLLSKLISTKPVIAGASPIHE
jgi:hypothetical protein